MADERRPDVDEQIDDLTLEALAEASAVEPTAGLRARVLADVRGERAGDAARRGLRRWRLGGGGAVAAAALLAALLVGERSQRQGLESALAQLEHANVELAARLDERQAEIAGLRETLAVHGEIVRILSGPRILSAGLEPPDRSGARARVVVEPGTGQIVVMGRDLRALEAGETYELWAIRGAAAPEPAGLFAPTTAQSFTERLPALAGAEEVTAFAISIEPEGGSDVPTGPIVLVGAVGT